MPRTIYKYELAPHWNEITGIEPVVIHVGWDPKSVDKDAPTVWVELDPVMGTGAEETIILTVVPTGGPVLEGKHVGSCVTPTGFVWHVYRLS